MDHEKDQQERMKSTAQSFAPDLGLPDRACVVDRPLDPCTITMFGASGDLVARKLVPSLYNLYLNQGLPTPFAVVGCSRKKWSREHFQGWMGQAVEQAGNLDISKWPDFARVLYYHPLEYDSISCYEELAGILQNLDNEHGIIGNRLYYLAIPPTVYETVGKMLGAVGLSAECENDKGWSRIVIEKPFGRDLDTAIKLDRSLHKNFAEHQIFRMDHYLAKETVQNVLVFRFGNAVFEPLWNRSYIDHVKITAAESIGVEHRAGYYEDTGVLRDMFQNHMMQLLSLIAMDPPANFEAKRVRDEKVKVFQSLRPLPLEELDEHLVLGQYGAGTIDGERVPGYREESEVDPQSRTPTYALMKVYLDNWRWQGVPIYLMSGKRLKKKLTEIVIQFKKVPHSLFRPALGERIMANRLTLGIQPDEMIRLTFQTKNPGATFCLRSVTMDFDYHQNYQGPRLDAYEKCVLDCIQGDHMLFWRQDGVEVSWSFLTPLLEAFENRTDPTAWLRFYEAGSWGPLKPDELKRFLSS